MGSHRRVIDPWWKQALLLGCPGLLALVVAAIAGPGSGVGLLLIAVAAGYFAIQHFYLQPWLSGRNAVDIDPLEELIPWYHGSLLACEDVAGVAGFLAEANRRLSGDDRILLIIGDSDGRLELHGDQPADVALAADAVELFAAARGLVRRSDLDPDSPIAGFLDHHRYQLALPLRDADSAMGVVLVATDNPGPVARQHFRWLQATASAAVARLRLALDIHEGVQLANAVDYARATQEALMPDSELIEGGGFWLHGVSQAATHCGGDVWTWASLGDDCLLVFIGDVTGHGLAPALLSATAVGAIQANAFAAGRELDVARLLSEVNRSVYRVARGSYMMTGFAAILDQRTREARFASAAQNFPFLLAPAEGGESGVKLSPLIARGPILGSDPDAEFEEQRHPFGPGAKLVMYTDGIIEAAFEPNKPFGERRLRRELAAVGAASADQIANWVIDEVTRFMDGRPADDDMTIVVAEWPQFEGVG